MLIRLSGAVAGMMAAAAGLGLFVPDLYRDNALVEAAWRGNDVVTLFGAVPLLSVSTLLVARGSRKAMLTTLGLLAYALYNYAFYLFGASFNSLFLVYVAILATSTVGLIAGVAKPEVRAMASAFRPARVTRMAGYVVVVISLGLGAFWTGLSVGYLVSGDVPGMVVATDHPTNVTGALDLWLVVTFGLLGGVWLVRGRGWGYVISTVWAVKGALYMTALSAAAASAYTSGASESVVEIGLWAPIGIACLAVSRYLIARVPSKESAPPPHSAP